MNKQILRSIIFGGLFVIPFIPFLVSSTFFFPFITTKAFAFRIIVEVVFAVWILLALLDADYRPKKSVILYAVLGFLGAVGLATVFSFDVVKSFWSNFERMEGFITILHLGAFFVVIGSVFNEMHWKRWFNTTLIASFLMVLYCFSQLAGVTVINQGGVRVDGTFGNTIYLAVYMLFHIFVAMFVLWRERKSVSMRWLYIILILGQLIVLYYTATRGAILGLLGGLFIVSILNIINKEDKLVRKTSIGLLLALIVLIGGFALMRETNFVKNSPVLIRFSSELTIDSIKTQGRYFTWPMAIEGFKENPVFGWGQENFIYVFQKHYSPEMYRLEPWFDRAHNVFLDWMVAGGTIALLAYLSLYLALLYIIWWKDQSFSHVEKSILTGLLATYFFNNLFVFDNLISYIFFFVLLAYIHQRNANISLITKEVPSILVNKIALPLVGIVFLLTFYFWNMKPLMANVYLIEALKSIQLQEFESAGKYFRKAYGASTLGRPEIMQHMASNSLFILESDMSIEKKNEFYGAAKSIVQKEAENFSGDARLQLVAGSFLISTGFPDEALLYLERAKVLSPGKQQVYFDLGSAYFAKNDPVKGLAQFKQAYELAPNYSEAKIIYLIGAIYTHDRQLENKLISELPKELVSKDIRIQYAYKIVGR